MGRAGLMMVIFGLGCATTKAETIENKPVVVAEPVKAMAVT